MKGNLLISTLICWAILFPGCLIAEESSLEYKIKAGYLYNFTKFVTWPVITGPTFNLCILGHDPFGTIIDPIEKKTAFSHSIKVLRLDKTNILSPSKLPSSCQILYVSDTNNHKTILEKIKVSSTKTQTLIVGEGEDFAAEGGMIGFIDRNGKIKLQVNLQYIKQTNLQISAKLLEIAELIDAQSHD